MPKQEKVMSEDVKDKFEQFRDVVLEEHKKGNIVYMGIDGPVSVPLQDFIKQPADGLLYDLNRDEATVLTFIKKHEKWVNDFAVAKVIRELKRQLDAK
jgi:hypothetical protein